MEVLALGLIMTTMKLGFEFISGYSQEYFIFFCTLLVVICLVTTWRDPYRSIPGPRGVPILGNTLDFAGTADQHALLLKWAKKYGNIFKYYVIFGKFLESEIFSNLCIKYDLHRLLSFSLKISCIGL